MKRCFWGESNEQKMRKIDERLHENTKANENPHEKVASDVRARRNGDTADRRNRFGILHAAVPECRLRPREHGDHRMRTHGQRNTI